MGILSPNISMAREIYPSHKNIFTYFNEYSPLQSTLYVVLEVK